MNKKLIKRVAVASLAALMTIPSLTTPINNSNVVYAGVAESLQKNINHAQEMIEKFKKEGNEEGVKNWTANLKKWQDAMSSSAATIKEESERKLKNAQKAAQEAAQAQALKAEQEYLATTVFPLTARYVKDFVPIVDDGKPHLYERPDLPGVIFTLEKDSLGIVRDLKPNVEIREGEDFHRETTLGGSTKTFDDICQEIKVTYISPFNFFGTGARVYGGTGSSFAVDTEKNGNIHLGEGWCHWIGKNREVSFTRPYHITYKSGWPDHYIGKSTNELPDGYFYDPNLRKVTIEEIKPNFKVEFSTQEKMKSYSTGFIEFNAEHGNSWVHEQDIYSVAREHGTDYTDEERQQLGLK